MATEPLLRPLLKRSPRALSSPSAGGGGVIPQTASALLGDETDGFALSAITDDLDDALVIKDTATPANDYDGSIYGHLPGIGVSAKMVIGADGVLGWSPHNLMATSDNFSDFGWTKTTTTVMGGQPDSDGGTSAFLLTATSTASSVRRAPTNVVGRWHTAQFIVHAGTSSWCYINMAATGNLRAWFDVTNGVVGSADAGLIHSIHTTRADGTDLPAGFYRVVCSVRTAGTLTVWLGQSDADNSTAVTSGRTIRAEKASVNYGKVALPYLATLTAAAYDTPYDWSKGGRRLLLEPSTTYNSLHGNDLTQAAWTKTTTTAAFDATGPDGEEASTLTATADNGTCIQSITSATNPQIFSAYVRRKTGAGTVSMTSNNGGAWTDIAVTSSWTRFWIRGASNPAVGFRLATSSDEIEVAYAINAASGSLANVITSPVPTHAAASVVRTGDVFELPLSAIKASSDYTAFFDYDRPDDSTFMDSTPITIRNAANTQYSRALVSSSDGLTRFQVTDGTTPANYSLYTVSSGERVQITSKIEANAHAMSVNGEPPGLVTDTPGISVDSLVSTSSGIYIRRILLVPRALAVDDIRTWRWQE